MTRDDRPVTHRDRHDDGLSMVVTAVSLVVVALLVLLALQATSGSGSSTGSTSPTSAAAASQAQQSLGNALSTLQQVDPGGQGSLDASALQSADPSLTYTTGASTGPLTLSVAAATDGGSVTLADRSTDGTCWYLWWSPSTGAWYGARTGQSSCTAPTPTGTPTPGPVSSSTIGWQQGSVPAA